VLSLYLDLDPTQFAAPPARATAVRSLLDDADRRLRAQDGLSHEDRSHLEASLARARSFLERELTADGSHAVAVFACEPADLFETIRLPRSLPSRVAIDRSPLVAPLARLERRERWCVALVSRRQGRLFRGSPDGLREVASVSDDVHGQHDQGGWSQARYQRGIEKEVSDHLVRVAGALLRQLERRPYERLVLGGPYEAVVELQRKLHRYVSERIAGRIDVDVETATPDTVLAAAGPLVEKHERERERAALERIEEGSRAVTGLEDVLRALNERRVELLLLDERFSARGTVCPECGWIGPEGQRSCPADGARLEPREDVGERAVELALQQSAELLPIPRREDGVVRPRGGIGAVLRF
jgi:peptide subunit release factor 1 (eRF1)